MVMRVLRKSAQGRVFKFLLFGILLLAAFSLAFTDAGGFFRSGRFGHNDVANIGKDTISLTAFDHRARSLLERANIRLQDAYAMGYMNEILAGMIREGLLIRGAADAGLRVDKEHVARRLKEMIEPMTAQGRSAKDVLAQILRSQGMSEAQLVQAIRGEMETTLLTGALEAAGYAPPAESLVQALYKEQNETRDATLVYFPDESAANVPAPKESDLQAAYDAMKEEFAIPEKRSFRIYTLDEAAVKKTVKVSDDDVATEYETNRASFEKPARKSVEQALFVQEETAKKVAQDATKSKDLRKSVQSVTGKNSDYLGIQDFTPEAEPPALKADLDKAAGPGSVIGPIKTPLGWVVAVLKETRPAETVSLEEATPEIRKDLESHALSEALYTQATSLEDLLSAGTPLEDIQKEVPVTTRDTPLISSIGQDENGKAAMDPQAEETKFILQAGFDLSEGGATTVKELRDGRFVAAQLLKLEERRYRPLTEVRAQVEKQWTAQQRSLLNQAAVTKALEEVHGGKSTLQKIAATQGKKIESLSAISRAQAPRKPLSARGLHALFQIRRDEPAMIDIEGGKALVVVTASRLPEDIKPGSDAYKKAGDEISAAQKQEMLPVYLQALTQVYPVHVNDELLQKIYAPKTDEAP